MLPSDNHNIYWFFPWRHIWMYRAPMHNDDAGAFRDLHTRGLVHKSSQRDQW